MRFLLSLERLRLYVLLEGLVDVNLLKKFRFELCFIEFVLKLNEEQLTKC